MFIEKPRIASSGAFIFLNIPFQFPGKFLQIKDGAGANYVY